MGIDYKAILIFGARANWSDMLKLIRWFDSQTPEENLKEDADYGGFTIPTTSFCVQNVEDEYWLVFQYVETITNEKIKLPSALHEQFFEDFLFKNSFPGTYECRMYLKFQ